MSIKKYTIKILIILIILITNIMFVQKNNVLATDFIEQGKNFLMVGEDEYNVVNKDALQGTSKSIFKVLLSMAICISVIIGAVLGFQFILGSVEGKAKVSEALIPYIIGCVVVFGAFTIWEIAVNIGNSAENAIKVPPPKEDTVEGSIEGAISGAELIQIKEFRYWYRKFVQTPRTDYCRRGKRLDSRRLERFSYLDG